MIHPDKSNYALYAIHRILCEARMMAYEKADHDLIAEFLDTAELMPEQIALPYDATEQFRDLLVVLMRMRPHISYLVEGFDVGNARKWGQRSERQSAGATKKGS